jgi:hypothetical protein
VKALMGELNSCICMLISSVYILASYTTAHFIHSFVQSSGLENRKLTAVVIHCADHATSLYLLKLALTSLTSGGHSVGIVRWQTKAPEYFFFGSKYQKHCTHYGNFMSVSICLIAGPNFMSGLRCCFHYHAHFCSCANTTVWRYILMCLISNDADPKGFLRWCIILRIPGFSDFVHHLIF